MEQPSFNPNEDQTSPEQAASPEMPFAQEKIPVVKGVEGFKTFIENYPDFAFCPYIAHKDPEGWVKSTSRTYMNQVLPNFLYVPVDIEKGDTEELQRFFELVEDMNRVPAVNITQPHKSAPTIRAMFLGNENSTENVDTLIRNAEGKLAPYDLNAPAFVEWFNDEIGSFEDKPVVLVGVGGVGEPMAKRIAAQHPSQLVLVDPTDKSDLAESLAQSTATEYHASLAEIDESTLPEGVIVINAAGKEGATDESGINQLLEAQAGKDGVFVDIRPHLEIDVVEKAKELGWNSHTGHGMNARNDYILLAGITDNLKVTPPTFEHFEELVAHAS
jgi:shikimate 5-dehydrogenase